MMMLPLQESGHRVFRATSALDRGFLKSKKGVDLANAELLFRTMYFVSHRSIYGAVAEWYGESAQQISAHACSIIG